MAGLSLKVSTEAGDVVTVTTPRTTVTDDFLREREARERGEETEKRRVGGGGGRGGERWGEKNRGGREWWGGVGGERGEEG